MNTAQQRELIAWIENAFEAYATVRGGSYLSVLPREPIEQHCERMRDYKNEFSKVLLGVSKGSPVNSEQLRSDLAELMRLGCPALDMVELILAYTRRAGLSEADILRVVGLTDERLNALKQRLPWIVDTVESLLETVSGPLKVVDETFSNKRQQRRVKQLVRQLPEGLRYMSELLKHYAPFEQSRRPAEESSDFILGLLYARLETYGSSYLTLSRILLAMRHVENTVLASGKYGSSTTLSTDFGDFHEKEELSSSALQRRLHRFWETSHMPKLWMQILVLTSTHKRYARQRQRGATLLTMLGQLQNDWDANTPDIIEALRLIDEVKKRPHQTDAKTPPKDPHSA